MTTPSIKNLAAKKRNIVSQYKINKTDELNKKNREMFIKLIAACNLAKLIFYEEKIGPETNNKSLFISFKKMKDGPMSHKLCQLSSIKINDSFLRIGHYINHSY